MTVPAVVSCLMTVEAFVSFAVTDPCDCVPLAGAALVVIL